MILLIGVDGTEMDVESIFALLLTRVTEPQLPVTVKKQLFQLGGGYLYNKKDNQWYYRQG